MQFAIDRAVIGLIVAGVLCGCAEGDYASVTISYRPGAHADQLTLDPPTRQQIVKAFQHYTEANGYKCRAHVKRVDEITCRGPKGLHMTFKPELNQPTFVAKFNWVESKDRTHAEFERHVSSFATAISRAVGDAKVRLADGA